MRKRRGSEMKTEGLTGLGSESLAGGICGISDGAERRGLVSAVYREEGEWRVLGVEQGVGARGVRPYNRGWERVELPDSAVRNQSRPV